jgi:hypothetical protein
MELSNRLRKFARGGSVAAALSALACRLMARKYIKEIPQVEELVPLEPKGFLPSALPVCQYI